MDPETTPRTGHTVNIFRKIDDVIQSSLSHLDRHVTRFLLFCAILQIGFFFENKLVLGAQH